MRLPLPLHHAPVTFDDYQLGAARTLNPSLDERSRLIDAAAGLAEESGEVLAHVRKHLYQARELHRERIADELGDTLWCVSAVATSCGLSLGDVARGNLAKLERRHPDRFASPGA